MSVNAETAFRVLPAVLVAATGWTLAWLATGSIDAADWLPNAVFTGLLVLAVAFSGGALRPGRAELGALAALVGLAGWEAVSISWTAVPSLARDEALLTLFYAAVFVLPLLTLRGQSDRLLASAAVAVSATALALGAALVLRLGTDQADHFYWGRRLSFPISYPNALAAVFLIGFWPAVMLSADRRRQVLVRCCSLAGATGIASASLTAQSKGSIAALTVSCALLFALSPLRLRLLVPAAAALGLTAVAYRPLTAPFRSGSVGDIRHAGTTVLVLTAVGAVAGLVYAVVDRRLALGARVLRLVRVGVGALAVVAAACVAVFFTQVYHSGWFGDQWRSFKHERPDGQASSHLLQLGSYRYDFWRVSLDEFEAHPLAGIGSRGFGAAYLQHRHGPETPARAHSVELDALSELGVIGCVLLVCALALPLVRIVTRMRARDPAATAAFAGAAYWLAHASVDWIWTVPACGVGFFLLLGIGAAGGDESLLGRRARLGVAAAALLAVLLFVPPWLSARFADQGDFSAAKALDPLSVEPYRLEASEAVSPRAAAEQLEAAVRKEPRVVDLRYELGLAYARAHEWRLARAALLEARRLAPGDPQIAEALKRLPKRSIRS